MAEVVPALKIVVVDDDPTGSQTVHSCPLLLRWDRASLRWGLRHPSPLLFLLANTRALDPAAAAARVRDIAQTLALVLEGARCEGWAPALLLVSRAIANLISGLSRFGVGLLQLLGVVALVGLALLALVLLAAGLVRLAKALLPPPRSPR